MSDGPLNEAKALDMVGLKSKIVGPAILPSRRLQQSTLPVETHIINTHADGPGQFDKSERPQSHLSPQTNALPAPGTHQAYITPPLWSDASVKTELTVRHAGDVTRRRRVSKVRSRGAGAGRSIRRLQGRHVRTTSGAPYWAQCLDPSINGRVGLLHPRGHSRSISIRVPSRPEGGSYGRFRSISRARIFSCTQFTPHRA